MWNECNGAVVWIFFGIALLWDWNENWSLPVWFPLLSFPNLQAYWVQHFHSIIIRIWNSSAISSTPTPLALFIVMLPKTHLTLHSRMSGSRWVITPSWLSGSLRAFLFSSYMYFCHLFFISYGPVRSIPFLSFIEPIFAWNVPLVSLIFLTRSLVFPILLFSSISLHWLLRRLFYLSLLFIGTLHSDVSFLFSFAFYFFSQLFVRPPQTTIFSFCISFSWGWFWSVPPVQCYEPLSIVLQALCLLDLILWIYSSPPLWNGFDRSYLNGPVVFPAFLNVSLNFAIRSSWSEPQLAPGLVFADCIELLHLQLQRI